MPFIPDAIAICIQELEDMQDRIAAVAEVCVPLHPGVASAAGAALAQGVWLMAAVGQGFGEDIGAVAADAVSEEGVAVAVGDAGELTAGRPQG